MQQLHEFLRHNSIWLFLFCFIWVIVGFGWRHYRHKRTGIVYPPVAPENIRFEERTASGHSHKTLFTRLGGARNCLHVTVTDAEVWIRPIFPFNALAPELDLEHRISKASITNAEPIRSGFFRTLRLDYRDERGESHRLTLRVRKSDEFLRALGLQGQAG